MKEETIKEWSLKKWIIGFFLDKAIDVLVDMSNEGKIDLYNHEEFEKNFRKAMEEKP